MVDLIDVGIRIRDKRIERGITQKELATKIRVSSQAVSKWERGVTLPEISNLKAISHILRVSVDYLIDNERAYS